MCGDVRMVQRRERLRFAREPGEPVGIAGERVRQDFQRDVAIELRIARAIHLPHAACADWAVTSYGPSRVPGVSVIIRRHEALQLLCPGSKISLTHAGLPD